ncbi:MAG: hypothetical protein HC803_08055 [Saprospiraceae bacterium]|nr:hypothetical protein [Saprospiraceae bacterium]
MKNLQSFSKNALNAEQTNNTKGGAYNIFCEIYVGRQTAKGEAIDPEVMSKLMVWDKGLMMLLLNMRN